MPLDTHTPSLDIPEIVRRARRVPDCRILWSYKLSEYFDPWTKRVVEYDPENELLLFEGGPTLDLGRVQTVLQGRWVRGCTVAACPLRCGRHCRILWLDTSEEQLAFGCRKCLGIRYASASTSCPMERARLAFKRAQSLVAARQPERRSSRQAARESRAADAFERWKEQVLRRRTLLAQRAMIDRSRHQQARAASADGRRGDREWEPSSEIGGR